MKFEKIPAGLFIFLGGGTGASVRWLLTLFIPFSSLIVTCGINIFGAFCLGLLLDFLADCGSDSGSYKALRLVLGTGFMGGFTTYSAFAVQSASLIHENPLEFFVYLSTTLILGLLACSVGNLLGAKLAHKQVGESS